MSPSNEAETKRKPGRPKLEDINTDDTKERMSEFIEKQAIAVANGDEWVETSPEIMKLLQPRGLGKDRFGKELDYFCWKGTKVCAYDQSEKIEEREAKTIHDRMHPDAGTKVISGAI